MVTALSPDAVTCEDFACGAAPMKNMAARTIQRASDETRHGIKTAFYVVSTCKRSRDATTVLTIREYPRFYEGPT